MGKKYIPKRNPSGRVPVNLGRHWERSQHRGSLFHPTKSRMPKFLELRDGFVHYSDGWRDPPTTTQVRAGGNRLTKSLE